ncbi:protein quick-to-court isoform X2 [Schistocerca gregaria]|uniref:protein quick-to-court isoform X2 n=1 Tax=Schistocerca gregaria TaxID=7010 RepID=UPI00211E44D2|nr:protein quick-to-court isoform X2 [Schistocerca gregaria]XP_049856034.1 protein quick-to-court isoform X2 [Schistocerca gregaria]
MSGAEQSGASAPATASAPAAATSPTGSCSSGGSSSRIPVARAMRRSHSMRLRGEQQRACFPIAETEAPVRNRSMSVSATSTPRLSRRNPPGDRRANTSGAGDESEDDADSVRSFGSACSSMSCDHAYFARNGTTFSGRRMRYVVHCSPHTDDTEEYLTPTQRASRQIRRLKALLNETRKDLESKDRDILRLTKEVVELRLFKASLQAAEDVASGAPPPRGADSSDDEPDAANTASASASPALPTGAACGDAEGGADKAELPGSLADSGHFEDVGSSSGFSLGRSPAKLDDREGERTRIVNMYERRLAELRRAHVDDVQDMKQRHNDKVEDLLQRLSDTNSRYCELRTEYDKAQDKIRELERETESLRKSMEEHEERNKNMYLKMYMKGQEAAKFEHADQVLEFAHKAPNRVSVPELLKQLQTTENELEHIKALYRRLVEAHASKGEMDPAMTLQFLKSAVYYFLTDRENHQGHLNAIKSILGYTESEKSNIERAYKAYLRK